MTREQIEEILLKVLRERFHIENPDRHAVLSDAYDLDSIDALEMLTDLEDTHGIVLTQTQKKELFEHRTVDAIVGCIDRALHERPPE
jgi:acyl carrier protein